MSLEKFSRYALVACLLALTVVSILFRASKKPANLSSHNIYRAHDSRIAIDELLGALKDLNIQYLETIALPHPTPNQALLAESIKIPEKLENVRSLIDQSPRQRFYVAQLGPILEQELVAFQQALNHLEPPGKTLDVQSKNQLRDSLRLTTMILEEQDRLISVDHDQLVRAIHTQSVLWHMLTGLSLLTMGILGLRLWVYLSPGSLKMKT